MLDLIPPSYASATARDAWVIIAHYIPSSDLCAASLVCHKWHDLFMPFLWGDPASHFGTDNDAVYGKYDVQFDTSAMLTDEISGPHSVPQDLKVCKARGKSLDSYTSYATCFV